MVKINSTIFRTITNETTGATTSIRLFGKTFTELKDVLNSVKINGLFKTSLLSKEDVECIKTYNDAIKANIPHQQAMEQATKGASDSIAKMIKNANGNTIALNQMTLGAKATSIAMNVLSTAANMLVMYAITKLITAWSDYKKKLRETAEEMSKQAEKSLDYVDSLLDLQQQLKDGTTSAEDLTTAFREQLRTMGYTETQIDTLIEKYGGLAGAINEATREALENARTDAYTDVATSGKSLEKEYSAKNHDTKSSLEILKESDPLIDEILEIMNDVSFNNSTTMGSYTLVANSKNAEDIYAYYQGLQQVVQLIQETANKTNNKELLNSHVYKEASTALKTLGESAKLYGDAINRLHSADAQLELSDYLKTNDIDSQETFDNYIDGIKNSTEYSESYKQVLISVANDAFPQFSASAKDATDSATNFGNKIDVLLDSYKKASEGISSLATAFKELTDSEYVSLDTISKIKEAVGDSVSNWDAYEQKLLSVKKGTAEYNQLMRELTYATLEKQLGGVNALANADEKYVAQLLKENGVLNANEVAHNAVERAKAKEWIQAQDNNDISENTIASLIQEANAAGISTNAYLELTAKEILFNNNELDTSQKCQEILAIASAAGVASTAYSTLTNQINEWKSAKLGSGTRTKTATDLGMTVINEKNRGKDGKGKGNLYVASDGKQFEDYEDAMYYQESLNNVSKISNAYSNTNFVLPDYSGAKTGSSKDTKETFDWIETAISRLQRTITNLGKTVSATWKSWTDRNSALKSQISAVTSEIGLQQQAADKYLALAESVTGLGGYKELVKNGALDISVLDSEKDKDTINAIKQYQEYYEAYLSCLDAKQDAEDELANLVREDFDMIAKQFDSEISLVEANIDILEAYIDQAEMKGNLVSKNYYSAMYTEEEKNLALLQQKYTQLSDKLSNGTIAQGSEEFNNMATEIKEVSKAIIESNTALEKYQKTIRELDWEVFDLIQDKIENITEESEFLIDLLGNSKLFNDDGSITSQGQATLGLHVANMKIYESQVKDYADELTRLDEQFANDPLDQNYLARREELVELQRDAILNCQNEKDSMKDLMSEGYDNLLSYMDKLISKRKELLSQAGDVRGFQKTIQEQTSDIDRLQNIINSYSGDLSEESKSAIQKYEVQLKEAESNLEDTLYDQYISDQEKMLDTLADDTNQWVNERLDNIDGLIEDVVSATDKNAEIIKTTLEQEISAVGGSLTIEMQNLWSGADGIKSVVGGVNNTLLEIKNLVQSMVKGGDAEASKNASGATSDVKPATKPATTPQSTTTTTQQSSAKTITVGGMINASGALIYDYAGDNSGERQYYRNSPYYRVLDERNGYLKVRHQSLSSGTTGWFKKSDVKAYATGGKVDYTGLAMVHGSKSKPELMLNAKDTENFIALKDALSIVAKTNMFDAIQSYAKMPNFSPNTNGNKNVEIHFENMTFPNVKNADDFITDLQHSKRFENIILEITDGKGDLSKYKW